MHPEKFSSLLATKVFTNGVHAQFVAKKSAETFLEVMHSANKLNYSELNWETKDLEAMTIVFP